MYDDISKLILTTNKPSYLELCNFRRNLISDLEEIHLFSAYICPTSILGMNLVGIVNLTIDEYNLLLNIQMEGMWGAPKSLLTQKFLKHYIVLLSDYWKGNNQFHFFDLFRDLGNELSKLTDQDEKVLYTFNKNNNVNVTNVRHSYKDQFSRNLFDPYIELIYKTIYDNNNDNVCKYTMTSIEQINNIKPNTFIPTINLNKGVILVETYSKILLDKEFWEQIYNNIGKNRIIKTSDDLKIIYPYYNTWELYSEKEEFRIYYFLISNRKVKIYKIYIWNNQYNRFIDWKYTKLKLECLISEVMLWIHKYDKDIFLTEYFCRLKGLVNSLIDLNGNHEISKYNGLFIVNPINNPVSRVTLDLDNIKKFKQKRHKMSIELDHCIQEHKKKTTISKENIIEQNHEIRDFILLNPFKKRIIIYRTILTKSLNSCKHLLKDKMPLKYI